VDGAPLPQVPLFEPGAAPEEGWAWDDRDLSLLAAFPDRDGFQALFSYDPAITPAPTVLKRFVVHLPPGTDPGEVHIAGTFSDWAQVPMEPGPEPLLAVALVPVPRGEWFWYKYTRGGWDTVEKWAGCEEASNRYEFGAAHPDKADIVSLWADSCN